MGKSKQFLKRFHIPPPPPHPSKSLPRFEWSLTESLLLIARHVILCFFSSTVYLTSPCKRKCWTNSVVPLYQSILWAPAPVLQVALLLVFPMDTLIKKKRKFSLYKRKFSRSSCKVIYDLRPPHIWLNICAFPHIWGSPLQLFPTKFPYLWGKFSFLFYQCSQSIKLVLWVARMLIACVHGMWRPVWILSPAEYGQI